jgi:uncharacterized protein (UPF0147 family)
MVRRFNFNGFTSLFRIIIMEISLNNQQIELLETVLNPIVTDTSSPNYTRTVALSILTKIKNEKHI